MYYEVYESTTARKFEFRNFLFGSAFHPDPGPNFGPVLKSSGLNFGSEPNSGSPNNDEIP